MHNLSFAITEARAEPYAAAPTLVFRLRIASAGPRRVHAIMLRCQFRIEPRRRSYSEAEGDRLYDLFGERGQWQGSMKPLLWTHASVMAPAFDSSTEIDIPVACTYDFEVVAAKYFEALDEGEIPVLALFSGTLFLEGERGFQVEQIPWDKEAAYRLPVRVWRDVMDRYFPGAAWIRLRRENFDALSRYKGRRALATWDDAVEALLAEAAKERT